MCTAMTLKTGSGQVLFGRTMDFSYPLDPELYLVPRGYHWANILNTHQFRNEYGFMGIGQDISPVAFADGINEMGFSAAVLYFPGYAHYDKADSQDSSRVSIASIELVRFLLGYCASVDHAKALLGSIRIVGVTDAVTNSVAPLHWMIADESGKSMVIEKTADGLHIMNNPIGVFSNSPDFQWHMSNLRGYMNVSPEQNPAVLWDSVSLTPFGQGAGTFGLPGDYTPPARFVRTAYHKTHALIPDDEKDGVNACFHIMESVSIPKGSVMTDRGTADYTQYTAFMNLTSKKYFFQTYDNFQIKSADLQSSLTAGPDILSLGKLNQPAEFGRM